MQLIKAVDANDVHSYSQEIITTGFDIHYKHELLLRWVCSRGNMEMVKALVEKGADIHILTESALCIACTQGHLALTQYLISIGCDVAVPDHDNALSCAAAGGHLHVVQYLTERSVPSEAHLRVAIRKAELWGRVDVAEYLKSLMDN